MSTSSVPHAAGQPNSVASGGYRDPQFGQQMPPPSNDDGAEINLVDIFTQLLARKWTILCLALLCGIIGAFIGQFDLNQYRATTTVQVEKRSDGAQLPAELIGELLTGESARDTSFSTEIDIIKSRLILGPVVEQLDFHNRVFPKTPPVVGNLLLQRRLPFVDKYIPAKYVRVGETLTLSSLIVKEERIGKSIQLRVTGPDTYVISDGSGETAEGKVGVPTDLGDHTTLEISALTAPAGREFVIVRQPIRSGVARLRNALSVAQRKGSDVVDFSFQSQDPVLSTIVVNTIVASYQERNLARRSATIDQSIEFIELQLPEIQATLSEATQALSEYRQERQTEELSLGTQELLEQAVNIETALEDLAFREEQLAQRVTPNHPDYRALIAEREQLERRREDIRIDLGNVPEAEQELATLSQRVERARQLELQLVNRVEQLRILKASTVGNIRILESAETARRVGPDRRRPAMLGGLLGFLLGVFLVLFRNYVKQGIEDARSIEQLGMSLFATINAVKGLKGARAGMPIYSLAQHDPQSIAVEAIRGFRTGLQFSLSAAGAKSLMLTSCAPSDGKSFLSLNLALVSAGTKNRVLLVDADMRRGELRRHFGIERKKPGLSDYLAGNATWEDVVYHDEESGVDFIWTGKYPPNPSELLATRKFTDAVRMAEKEYDIVILDAPPALAVTDPGIIGQSAGLSLLVVSHLKTTKTELLSAQKTLINSGVHLSGVIFNQFDPKRSRYGSYGAQYGYYSGGYSYKYE